MLVVLLVGFAVMYSSATEHILRVQMAVVPNPSRLIIQFNITNPGNQTPLDVLTYGTPLEGIRGPIFEVSDLHGNAIPYIGKVVGRVWPPPPSSFIHLGSGESSVVEADLTYEFDFPGAGDYGIRFIPPYFQNDVQFIPATNNVIAHLNRKPLNPHQPETFGSTNCTALENSKIQNAIINNNGAKQLTYRAWNCLSRKTCNALSTRWFGKYSQVS